MPPATSRRCTLEYAFMLACFHAFMFSCSHALMPTYLVAAVSRHAGTGTTYGWCSSTPHSSGAPCLSVTPPAPACMHACHRHVAGPGSGSWILSSWNWAVVGAKQASVNTAALHRATLQPLSEEHNCCFGAVGAGVGGCAFWRQHTADIA